MIVLAYPKTGSDAKGVSTSLPLSVLTIAAVLVQDHEVIIYDERVNPVQKYLSALERQPLFVGISAMTGPQITYGLNLSKLAKSSGICTAWGGVHPSLFPRQTVEHPYVDWVIPGEGELATFELASALSRGKTITDSIIRRRVPHLDILPECPYDLVDMENYINTKTVANTRTLPTSFSRGCSFRCAFCCNPVLSNRRWRCMRVDLASARIHRLVERFNLDNIWFYDENILGNTSKALRLFDSIGNTFKWMVQCRADSLLKVDLPRLEKNGMIMAYPGLESGSPRILNMIHKDETVEDYVKVNRQLADSNIQAIYNWIIGFPNETWDDVLMTVDLSLKLLDENLSAQHNSFYTYVPYPRTALADSVEYRWPEKLEDWADYNRHHFKTPWIQDTKDKLFNVALSSKFVGRRLPSIFPDDVEVKYLQEVFTAKWREHDFDSRDWNALVDKAENILTRLFSS